MTDLFEKWLCFIRDQGLFFRGGRILVAVSGGMDSIVLLDLFSLIREPWSLSLAAAHVQHGIRGREAEEDEAFVAGACRRYGLPFLSMAADAPSFSRDRRISLETGSRQIRQAVLASFAGRLAFDAVALAHQADDQAETILLNLVRGSGLRGMAGMRPRRDLFVRPLLFAAREEIESYCRNRKLAYRTDSTNSDIVFSRNRMRWHILSNLKKEFGNHVAGAVCRAGEAVREAETVVDQAALRAFRRSIRRISPDEIALDIYQFLQYFKGIRKAVLIRLFETIPSIGRRPNRIELNRVLWLAEHGKSGAVFPVNQSVSVVKSGRTLVFHGMRALNAEVPVDVGRSVLFHEAGIRITSQSLPWDPEKSFPRDNPNVVLLDADAAAPPYAVRPCKKGDWFIPLGMTGKKKLHDFFIDSKVPRHRRERVPLFTSNRRIAWVAGMRLDDRFKVTDKTNRVLKLEIESI
jgi:tRNA(Ile)-lysidine synthase